MWTIALAAVAILGRLTEPLLDPGGKLVACGISVGAFMLLFPILLASSRRYGLPKSPWLGTSLLIAVSLSIFLRAANSSLDLSESGAVSAPGLGARAAGRLADLEITCICIWRRKK